MLNTILQYKLTKLTFLRKRGFIFKVQVIVSLYSVNAVEKIVEQIKRILDLRFL